MGRNLIGPKIWLIAWIMHKRSSLLDSGGKKKQAIGSLPGCSCPSPEEEIFVYFGLNFTQITASETLKHCMPLVQPPAWAVMLFILLVNVCQVVL